MVDVVNALGTKDCKLPSGYESWINYWNKKRGKTADHCYHCPDEPTKGLEGGHVNKVNYDYFRTKYERENTLYIVPLCKNCNNHQNEEPFSVDEEDLVPAPDEYNVVGNDFV